MFGVGQNRYNTEYRMFHLLRRVLQLSFPTFRQLIQLHFFPPEALVQHKTTLDASHDRSIFLYFTSECGELENTTPYATGRGMSPGYSWEQHGDEMKKSCILSCYSRDDCVDDSISRINHREIFCDEHVTNLVSSRLEIGGLRERTRTRTRKLYFSRIVV